MIETKPIKRIYNLSILGNVLLFSIDEDGNDVYKMSIPIKLTDMDSVIAIESLNTIYILLGNPSKEVIKSVMGIIKYYEHKAFNIMRSSHDKLITFELAKVLENNKRKSLSRQPINENPMWNAPLNPYTELNKREISKKEMRKFINGEWLSGKD